MNKKGNTSMIILVVVIIAVVIILFKFGPETTGSTTKELKEGCIDTDKPTDYEGRDYYNIYKRGSAYRYTTACLGEITQDCLLDTQDDSCIDQFSLKEIYCYNGQILNSVVKCKDGCEAGKCLD